MNSKETGVTSLLFFLYYYVTVNDRTRLELEKIKLTNFKRRN